MIKRKIMEKKRLFYMNRKAIPVLVLALIVCITSSAQKLKVNYENNMDSLSNFMLQYYRMQNVQSFHLTLKGDFNGKRAKIHKVTCNNGIFTECQRSILWQFLMGKTGFVSRVFILLAIIRNYLKTPYILTR